MTYRCPDSHLHGRNVTCHKTHGCRCEPCRARAARHHQELKAKKTAGFVGFVPIRPTRDHLAGLIAGGMTQKHISARSGISEPTITRIMLRRQDVIHSNTARALLAVPLLESVQAGGGVDGRGTRRRLGALMALGYTGYFLSSELGTYKGYVSDALHREHVSARYRAAVHELYDRLSMTVPPDTPAGKRARLFARKLGHVPPLMWADIDNDNEPVSVELDTDRATHLLDELNHFRQAGESPVLTARAIGRKPSSLARLADRHHRGDLARWIETAVEKDAA